MAEARILASSTYVLGNRGSRLKLPGVPVLVSVFQYFSAKNFSRQVQLVPWGVMVVHSAGFTPTSKLLSLSLSVL